LSRTGFGNPIFMREASIVSLRYMKQKLATLRALRFRVLGLLLGLSPSFVRNRLFRFLHSRTVALTRVTSAHSRRPRLSVVVPVYNEQATFVPLMDQLLDKTIEGVDIEVIIVESNSQDGTREQVLRYQSHPRVRVVLEERPQGKGHAVRKGFELATGDVILIQDADLEYDIGDYDALLDPILRFERNFVIGSRHTPKGKFWKMREFNDASGLAGFFNFGHLLFLTLFNVIYQQRLKDPFSMFKVFRRDCLHGLDFECKRFDFDFELTIKLLRKGYAALELPVNYRARSFAAGKKVSIWRDPLTWVKALAKFRTSPLYGNLERRR
jgi:glycosyltransferase involved in cell wall biosynthesis